MIQGSLFATSPPNAQGVPRREEDVTLVKSEARISSWRGKLQQSLTMRTTLSSTRMMNISNVGIGKKGRLTKTSPNRNIPVKNKIGVRE